MHAKSTRSATQHTTTSPCLKRDAAVLERERLLGVRTLAGLVHLHGDVAVLPNRQLDAEHPADLQRGHRHTVEGVRVVVPDDADLAEHALEVVPAHPDAAV